MKIISRKTNAVKAKDGWYKAYFRNGYWGSLLKGSSESVYESLVLLGDSPSPDDVDKVIGNNSWTKCMCDECEQFVEFVIQVGEEPDYESSTANICKDCLGKAREMVIGIEK